MVTELQMREVPSLLLGPIPPDPSLFPQHYSDRPESAHARLDGAGTLGLLTGPLAPDPLLYPGSYSARTPTHGPRIRPNAIHILERGQRGIVGELLKLDTVSNTPVPKQKQRARDFGKENVYRLREIQKRCKELEAERAHSRPVKALWTSSRYDNIPSKVMTQPQVASPTVKPSCQNYLKAHSNGGFTALSRPRSKTSLQRADSTNSAHDLGLQLRVEGHSIDFIKHNARAAGKTVIRRSQSLTNLRDKPVPSAVKGQVPEYIEKRKQERLKKEEEMRKNLPDPTVPAGHTLIPENERQETLKTLTETQHSLVNELLNLPLTADNLRVRSKKNQLNSRLSEIEEAIRIFSKERVYIKIDS